MEDLQIVQLFLDRSEKAIEALSEKFGKYLNAIAFNVLSDKEDAEECVNDVLVHLWNKALPEKIISLKAYLSKLVRNRAITTLREKKRKKRGGEIVTVSYEELSECIPDPNCFDADDDTGIKETLDSFLIGLSKENRIIFMKRYWFSLSVSEIAKQLGKNERYVTNKLYVMRKKLQKNLKKKRRITQFLI